MIGKITGRIEYKTTDHVLIDVRGVGYAVYCSDRVLAGLPAKGEYTALYTDLLVREDLLQLFGFADLVEKEWHRLLTGVQGIGPKASLAILGVLGADGVSRAIALEDWSAIARAKGVGPKTAQRAVMELKNKAPAVMAMTAGAPAIPDPADDDPVIMPDIPSPAMPAAGSERAEALSALGNLGYSPSDAAAAVAAVQTETPDADTADLIKSALRRLAPKG